MSTSLLPLGEQAPGTPVPVLHERAVRAAAGLLFLFAMIAFMDAWLVGHFEPTRIFAVALVVDFALRPFVSPRGAPSLIVGRWLVRRLQPKWSGAPRKRLAWGIGFMLALVMLWPVVVQKLVGPVNLLVYAVCLSLLFFETAFGIGIGGKRDGWLRREAPRACSGGACTVTSGLRLRPGWPHGLVVLAFSGLVAATAHQLEPSAASVRMTPTGQASTAASKGDVDERCRVPEFAKAIGHEEMWKRHNNCL
jgi:hypothetical protein